jgi:type II secretory pathway pseudopilin PulG
MNCRAVAKPALNLPLIHLLFMNHYQDSPLIGWAALALFLLYAFGSCQRTVDEPLPDTYKQSGSFIKSLPYYNPDSCVLLIRRNVPPRWQGAAYENLFLDGPEDSPLQLGFKHLDYYEKNFPADTAREFALLWRGRLYTHLGKFDSAQTCLQASYESSIRHKRYIRAGDAQEGLAGIYYKQGNTAQAIRAFLAVYDAVKNLDTTQIVRKITAIANIASAYSQSDDQQEALNWVKRRIPMTADETKPEMRVHKVDTYKQLAVIYERLNLPDSAIFMAQKTLELQEKYKTINDQPELLIVLGASYLAKGACPMALQYIQQAIRTRRGNNPTQHLIQIGALADAYLCLGRLDSAELLYEELIRSSNMTDQSYAFTKMSDIYTRQGQYKAAYDAIQSSLKIRQKMFDDKQIQAMATAKSELKLEQTQHQLAQSEQKHQNERLQKLVGVLMLSLALGAAMALFFRQRNRRRILEQENQLLAQEKELAQARALLSEKAFQQSQVVLKTTQDELDTTAQLLALKNQLIEELELRFTQEHLAPDEEMPPGAAENIKMVHIKILNEKDWVQFRDRFEQYLPGIFQHLKDRYPSLTSAETRLFMLIKLNFNTFEISEALGISKESVWRSRHRLSQKLGLEETKDLDGFVVGFSIH